MKFSDEVVCIDESGHPFLKEGDIYPLLAYSRTRQCGCKDGYVDVGMKPITTKGVVINAGDVIVCEKCGNRFNHSGVSWLLAKRFAPIDSIDISALTEVLETEPFSNQNL